MQTTAVKLFFEYLKNEHIKYVFGIPGGLLHPFFVELEHHPDINLIVSKHEEGAAFMADGYARVSGTIGVCAATAGPGATNLLTGVAVAFSDCVPLLVITGQAASHMMGKGAAQETTRADIDLVGMFRSITKYSAMVPSPDRIGDHLRRALKLALTGRKGPVHLNIPVDFWGVEVPNQVIPPEKFRPKAKLFDRDAVVEVAETLLAAKNPVIIAGSGVLSSGAERELKILVEQVGIRVATTPAAKGIFAEDHPLSLGVLGFAGHRSAKDTIFGDDVDVLFCVGASLNETTTFGWQPALAPSETLIQLDIDIDRIARNYGVDIALVGDAKTVLNELYFHISRLLKTRKKSSTWVLGDSPFVTGEAFANPELRDSKQVPLSPPAWRKELTQVLPKNAIIFSDVGGHMLFNIQHLTISEHQSFHLNLHFGSMGHGTVAPIGAKLASERPVYAIIGDACFAMNGMELLVASEYSIPVTWIVENNQMHGITYHGSKMLDGQGLQSIVNKKKVRPSIIAQAMGLRTAVVKTPGELKEVIFEFSQSNEPCLVEVVIDPDIAPPLKDRANTIGFRDD